MKYVFVKFKKINKNNVMIYNIQALDVMNYNDQLI